MLKNIWTIICKSSLVDKDNNSLSLSEILEKIKIDVGVTKKTDKSISIPLDFQIVSFWVNSDGKERKEVVKIEMVDPNNKNLFEKELEISFKKGMRRMRFRALFHNFLVTVSGDYLVNVYLKDKSKKRFVQTSSTPIEVIATKTIVPQT